MGVAGGDSERAVSLGAGAATAATGQAILLERAVRPAAVRSLFVLIFCMSALAVKRKF